MTPATRDELLAELRDRGFDLDGEAPNKTISLGAAFLDECDPEELLAVMTLRRVKGDLQSHEDAELVIAALKAVIDRRG